MQMIIIWNNKSKPIRNVVYISYKEKLKQSGADSEPQTLKTLKLLS
jgi:hypothetical protein